MTPLIQLCFTILVLALFFGLLWYLISLFPALPPPFPMVLQAVLVIVAFIILIDLLLPYTGGHLLR